MIRDRKDLLTTSWLGSTILWSSSLKRRHWENRTYKGSVLKSNSPRVMDGIISERIRMATTWTKLDVKADVIILIGKTRLNWFGHLIRRGERSFVYISYRNNFPGNGFQLGRSLKRVKSQIIENTGIPLLTHKRIALGNKK